MTINCMNVSTILRKIKNTSSVFSQVSLVAGGTVIAQALNMLVMPILSRIYSPEDFGIMSVFVAVMTILVPVASLQYYFSVALPKSKRYANSTIVLSMSVACVTVFVSVIILMFFGSRLFNIFNISAVIPYKYLIPIGTLLYVFYMIFTQWAIREAEFGVIARTKITQSVSGNIIKIILGFLNFKPIGLIIGTIVSYGGGISTILRNLIKKGGFPKSTRTDIKRVAVKYRKFPCFDMPAMLLNSMGTHLVPIIIFSFFGAKVAGLFSVANQLLVIPSVFLGSAIGQVFLQKASVEYHKNNLATVTINTYRILLHLGSFPMVMLGVFAPLIFKIVFGEQWIDAGVYAQMLVIFILFSFVFSPISIVHYITNTQDVEMYMEIMYFITRVSAFVIAAKTTNNPMITIGCFSVAGGISVLIRTYFALKVAGIVGKDFVMVVCTEVGKALVLSAPVILALIFIPNIWICVVVALIMTGFYLKSLWSVYAKLGH